MLQSIIKFLQSWNHLIHIKLYLIRLNIIIILIGLKVMKSMPLNKNLLYQSNSYTNATLYHHIEIDLYFSLMLCNLSCCYQHILALLNSQIHLSSQVPKPAFDSSKVDSCRLETDSHCLQIYHRRMKIGHP